MARTLDLTQARGELTLSEPERFEHVYVTGRHGYGKTNLLTYLILQDINAGRGVAVLTPHGDLIDDHLLPRLPQERVHAGDIIHFNPADQAPVPFNIFHSDAEESYEQLAAEAAAVLNKAMAEIKGTRMRALFKNALLAVAERDDATIDQLATLISPDGQALRDEVIETTHSDLVRDFFRNRYPEIQHSAGGILDRLQDFRVEPIRTILSHRPTFSLYEAMNEGKVLLCNLSKGALGEAQRIIGQLIIAKIRAAAFARDQQIPEARRAPFYLYIDEFHVFAQDAGDIYAEFVEEMRKFRIGLTVAHQHADQLPRNVAKSVGGSETVIAFHPWDEEDAKKIAAKVGAPDANSLMELDKGETFVRRRRQNRTFLVKIPDMRQVPTSEAVKAAAVATSRERYGTGGAMHQKQAYEQWIHDRQQTEAGESTAAASTDEEEPNIDDLKRLIDEQGKS